MFAREEKAALKGKATFAKAKIRLTCLSTGLQAVWSLPGL